MAIKYIERMLWYETDNGVVEIPQSQLLGRAECLVILGEAGMGKTSLLEQFSDKTGYACCKARTLIRSTDPHKLLGDAQVLVIDALDEVASTRDGDVIDLVLRQLEILDNPRFVMSCRVSDWRSATGEAEIRVQYAKPPLALHLKPFTDSDIIAFLCSRLDEEQAKIVVEHFNNRDLAELLGNPQTLVMIADIAKDGRLPENRRELFAQATDRLCVEHNDSKADSQLPKEAALTAAGAACTVLILTGSESISRKASANIKVGELSLADVSLLPGGADIATVIASRLFKAQGGDRFSYIHRRVGEYLAAQWLAKQADTPRKRRRLLAMFHHNGLVPASLRGLHAWLAQDPFLRADVIAVDPMGVVEYGDADTLSPSDARVLLHTLAALLKINPKAIGWGNYAIRSLAHPDLVNELKPLIIAPHTEFRLQLLILDSLAGSAIAGEYTDELNDIILNKNADLIVRKAAGKALADLQDAQQWAETLVTLNNYQDEDSIRLAVELLGDIGYDKVSDQLIGDLVMSYIQIDSRTIGTFIDLERNLPDHRLVRFLDHLTVQVNCLGDQGSEPHGDVLSDFINHLIIRALNTNKVTAKKMWSWLEPLDPNAGYQTELKQQLASIISGADELRRQVQRLVLLESTNEQNVYLRMHYLRQSSPGFIPSNQDVVALLAALEPEKTEDECWQQVVRLVDHDSSKGAEVRAAASRFAQYCPERIAWLKQLTMPYVSTYTAEAEEKKRVREELQAQELTAQRESYAPHIQSMQGGDYKALINPAKAYLRFFADIPKELPAHQRIEQWLGAEIADAAHLGFESFLQLTSSQPTMQEVAGALAEDKHYLSGYIMVAALAERFRQKIGFDVVSSNKLIVGFFELYRAGIEARAGIEGLKAAIEQTLKARGDWEKAIRLFYESQLSVVKEHINFHEFMTSESDSALATSLAAEWLEQFPELSIQAEKELIDRLVRSKEFGELSRIASSRLDLTDDERQNIWDAIGLLINFEQTAARLKASNIVPELLWNIRDRCSNNRYRYADQAPIAIGISQLEWMIREFRTKWAETERPNGVTIGDKNPWNASSYITDLISQLGGNVSEAAGEALHRLQSEQPDGYTESIKTAIAERTRQLVEAAYAPPELQEIKAVIADSAPATNRDLLAFMLEELETVQKKITSDDVDSWQGFYDDKDAPYGEERCRDYLLTLLRQGEKGVVLDPERHVAADKRVDITCSVGTLRLPIEIKGQWHRELWTAADIQLDGLYTPDWQAGGFGIYLVLWFGNTASKKLYGPSKEKPKPSSPEELREQLAAASRAAREGRVEVVVLDLARP